MTTVVILNIAFVAFVLTVIVGMLAWAIRTARPSVATATARNPRVREEAVRARARADRARPTRHSASQVGA